MPKQITLKEVLAKLTYKPGWEFLIRRDYPMSSFELVVRSPASVGGMTFAVQSAGDPRESIASEETLRLWIKNAIYEIEHRDIEKALKWRK